MIILKSLECGGTLLTNCISCNTTNTHRDAIHASGECPCLSGYIDTGSIVCTASASCHHSW